MAGVLNEATVRAAWTAMDQTYGHTQPGYALQPIDNGGQGRPSVPMMMRHLPPWRLALRASETHHHGHAQ
jgi:hypothetical protein